MLIILDTRKVYLYVSLSRTRSNRVKILTYRNNIFIKNEKKLYLYN